MAHPRGFGLGDAASQLGPTCPRAQDSRGPGEALYLGNRSVKAIRASRNRAQGKVRAPRESRRARSAQRAARKAQELGG